MKKILIIEDDPVVGTVYRNFLTRQGFDLDWVKDGAAALDRVATFVPDVVLLDLMIPKVSGLDVLRALRAEEAYSELYIIVLTNAAVPALVQQARELGANQVFDKSQTSPISITELLHTRFNTNSPAA